MRNKINTLVMAAVLGCAGVANATLLSDLIRTGGTITIDDKVFSGFGITSQNTALRTQAGELDVTTSILGGVDILSFTGPLALDNTLGTSTLLGDVTLLYHVTATGGNKITMIDQAYTPNGLPGSGQIIIGETAQNIANGVSANSTLTLVPTDLIDPASEAGDNLLVVPGQTDLDVTKDILITANAGFVVGLSQVDQSFHQNIPDGGLTLALLGFAMVGVEGLRRKLGK